MPKDVAKAWHSLVESRGSSEVSASSKRIIRISDSNNRNKNNNTNNNNNNNSNTEKSFQTI